MSVQRSIIVEPAEQLTNSFQLDQLNVDFIFKVLIFSQLALAITEYHHTMQGCVRQPSLVSSVRHVHI